MSDPISLNPVWFSLADAARRRDAQKRNLSSSRYLTSNPHFLGLLAEYVYANATGLEVNRALIARGDGGTDFPGVDVKGSTHWDDPWLKHPADKPLRADSYVLVALDLKGRQGRLVGVASRQELADAEQVDWGHGPQLSIQGSRLHPVAVPA